MKKLFFLLCLISLNVFAYELKEESKTSVSKEVSDPAAYPSDEATRYQVNDWKKDMAGPRETSRLIRD